MEKKKRDLIQESKELGIVDVKFSGEGNIIKATENLYDSIKKLDEENEEIKKFLKS